jgi:beta-lactamase regulating signal transducer with metallopeptidase domain
MNPAFEHVAQRMAGALITGLYQGIVLAALLWLGIRFFRGMNAATRHMVALVGLLAVALLPVLHFMGADTLSGAQVQPAGTLPDVSNHRFRGDGNDQEVVSTVYAGLAEPHQVAPLDPGLSEALARIEVDSAMDLAGGGAPASAPPTAISGAGDGRASAPTARSTPDALHIRNWRAEVPGMACIMGLAALAVVAAVRLSRLAVQSVALARLKRNGTPASGGVAELFDEVRSGAPIDRPVRLLAADRVSTPMAVGYWKPAIILPAGLISEADGPGLESVLRHELAHIQRRDDWVNLLQQCVAAVLFFHPAVWWLSRRLTLDREIACDDHALEGVRSRQEYALFLTEFAGRSRGHRWIAAPAAWSRKSQLKERINMILDMKRNTSPRLARASAGIVTLATIATASMAVIAGPRLVLAKTPDPAGAPSTDAAPSSVASVSSGTSSITWNEAREIPAASSVELASYDSNSIQGSERIRSKVTARNGRTVVNAPVEVATTVDAAVEATEVVEVPAPPAPPGEPAHPKGPKPAPVPTPSRRPVPPAVADESLERRIDRLERQLEKLAAEKEKSPLQFSPKNWEARTFALNKENNPFGSAANAQAAESEEWKRVFPAWPMTEEQQKAVDKAMKDANEQVARAMKDLDLRTHGAERRAGHDAKLAHETAAKEAGVEAQRRILEEQKRALERQMSSLNRQLEDLDKQMGRLDEHLDHLDERVENLNRNEDSTPGDQPALPRLKEKKEVR